MAEVNIEKIEVIVRENIDDDPLEKAVAEAHGVKPKGSTVGVKFRIGDSWHGTYVCFKQSKLSVSDVIERINDQFKILLKEVRENG